MSATEKKRLLDALTKSHLAVRRKLDDIDFELIVYAETGWRVRDIVGHIATWDREVAKSLRAYMAGFEYLTPDLDEEENQFNEAAVREQQKLTSQQILEEFEKAYDELWVAIADIPSDHFPGELRYPWGDERDSIAQLVEYMIEHAVEHQEEILKTIQDA